MHKKNKKPLRLPDLDRLKNAVLNSWGNSRQYALCVLPDWLKTLKRSAN